MEILQNIDVEVAAICMAGLVLLRLAYELHRIYRESEETPPRLIPLDRAADPGSPEMTPAPRLGCNDDA